jgi:diguanylate cyclase (GGDEF)-like protein
MATLRKKRRDINDEEEELTADSSKNNDLDSYAKEVLNEVIKDNLPPTPSNYALYFERNLENKSEEFKKQVHSIIELEESNDAENTILLEQNLKQGFVSIKNILSVSANLYKNISLMVKILDKRKKEFMEVHDAIGASSIATSLENDVTKLSAILKKQTSQLKEIYDETGNIVKKVENETIFDNRYGLYNKRYLLSKISKELELIKEFGHKSSLIMIELSKDLKNSIHNDKVITLMTRTIARLLLKTSRRSDTVAHYGNGIFVMLLKHTDIQSAKKASERLCDLVANSNFFLADKEIQLKISIGITELDIKNSVEETIVFAMEAMDKAFKNPNLCYAVENRTKIEENGELL